MQLVRLLRQVMVSKEKEVETMKARMRKELEQRLSEALEEVDKVRKERLVFFLQEHFP